MYANLGNYIGSDGKWHKWNYVYELFPTDKEESMRMIKPHRRIEIQQCTNGSWIVTVGCCNRAYIGLCAMMDDIRHYIRDPEKVEKEYNDFTESDSVRGCLITDAEIAAPETDR